MNGNEYRTVSYVESAARDNSIFTAWTRKWGIHVRPWYAMDKLKFSFVDVGKAGKGDSFDICMDIVKYGFPCFKKWANDILSNNNRFERVMDEELKAGEKYPKAYKYVTGEKADKTIGICNSSKGGYVINASVVRNGKRIIANVPVDLGDLQILADAFRRTYEERERKIVEIRKKAEEEIAAYSTDSDVNSGHAVIEDNNTADAQPVTAQNNEKDLYSEETIIQTSDNLPNMEDTPVNITVAQQSPASYKLKVTLAELPEKQTDGFIFNGFCKDKGGNVSLFAPKEIMLGEQKNKWSRLADMLKDEKVTIMFMVSDKDNKTIIEKIA